MYVIHSVYIYDDLDRSYLEFILSFHTVTQWSECPSKAGRYDNLLYRSVLCVTCLEGLVKTAPSLCSVSALFLKHMQYRYRKGPRHLWY